MERDIGTHHNIIKTPPPQTPLRNHRRSNQRRQHGSKSIKRMQKPQHLIWIRHIANPRIPRRVREAIAEAREHEDDDEHGVRRVHGDDDVGDEVAGGRDDGDAALAEAQVDGVVEEGGGGVADERGEEDEGDDDEG